MPHDQPALPDLLRTVREFVDELGPRLDGQDRYHALCASYLLDIAGREIADWTARPSADDARLAALVDGSAGMTPGEVVVSLCTAIRAGHYDHRLPELFEILHAHVEDKVRVSRPDYLADDIS